VESFVLSVFSAAAVAFVLGVVWYAPFGFGDAFLAAAQKKREDLGGAAVAMGTSFAALVASAAALHVLLRMAGIDTVSGGAWVGTTMGVLVAAAMLSDYLFCGWPLTLFAIQAGYRVCYLALMGLVLGVWRA
jgi:hypothetical protein